MEKFTSRKLPQLEFLPLQVRIAVSIGDEDALVCLNDQLRKCCNSGPMNKSP